MNGRQPIRRVRFGGFGGGGGSLPNDVIALLIIVFVTFSAQFFRATAGILTLFRLTPEVWRYGFLWQLATYPFVGSGSPDLWLVIELFILYLFARDVFFDLGRKTFWRLLIVVGAGAGVVAVAIALLQRLLTGGLPPAFAVLLQGQTTLLTILVAAFATLNRRATIYLFFVLPIEARWFLPLELLFAFLGFLSSHDLAGFLGLCAAVGLTYFWLGPRHLKLLPRQLWLRLQEQWMRWRLARMRRRRGLRLVSPDDERKNDQDLPN
ncbi:MAG TPA: hypothetical protein VKA53_00920 [Thermoanaerobaculia bacterium]|nr:hypothetical protein [Thermoanaerobaculia bacterium]